jgi:TonB-linked SusC/RagA family outer membrane protein
MKKLIGLIACIMLLGLSSVFAQSKEVTGTITDMSGLGMPGVSVSIKGTTEGTNTDIDGKWGLTVSPKDIIIISFVGMKTQEITVGDKTVMDILLEEDRVSVDEVMVVAYGVVKKESFTGSATSVKKESLVKIAGGVGQKLQGNVAGVQVMGTDVRIRGFGSVTGNANPLYVIDGVINAPRPADDDIESITVLKDAASTALYGARGANGVIVITSKKGKRNSKPVFNFKYQRTVKKLRNPEWDRANSGQQYKYVFDGLKNKYYQDNAMLGDFDKMKNGRDAAATYAYSKLNNGIKGAFRGYNPYNMDEPFNSDGSLKKNSNLLYSNDWQNSLLKNSIKDEIYFSVSGGAENSNYHWATRAYDYNGFIDLDHEKGMSSQFNYSVDLNDRIKTSIVSKISYTEGRESYTKTASESNLLYVGYTMTPVAPIYQQDKVVAADGTWTYKDKLLSGKKQYDWGNPNYQNYNPLALMKYDQSSFYTTNVYVAPTIDIKIIDGLSYKLRGSARLSNNKEMSFQHPLYGSGITEGGLAGRDSYAVRDWNMHTSFKYKFDLSEDQHFDLFAGYEANYYILERMGSYAKGYPLEAITTETSRGAKPQKATSSTIENSTISYISNLNYNLMDKYYLSASFRRDGSSRFGSNSRWGNFWSVGGSWRISQEDFLQIDWINNLKLRASYGVLGSNAIDDYLFGDYYSVGSFYNAQTGLSHTGLPNPSLKWEQSDNLSIGLDFNLFDSKLSGTFEVYRKNTQDLLFRVPLPLTSGFPNIMKNNGDMVNNGYEIELRGTPVSGDFTWDITGTVSQNFNEITKLPAGDQVNGTKRFTEGGTVYNYYLREWAGVDSKNGSALWYIDQNVKKFDGTTYAEVVKSVDADGYADVTYVKEDGSKVTDKVKLVDGRLATASQANADKMDIGDVSAPKIFGSISNNFSYKGIDLSFQVIGGFGHKIYDGRYKTFMHDGSDKASNISTDALDFWSPANTSSSNPVNVFENGSSSDISSTRWLVDGGFVKLKNITLGYTLPQNLIRKLYVSNLRVFGTVDNLLTISDFKSGDPEISLSGVGSSYRFDNATTVRFGITVKF